MPLFSFYPGITMSKYEVLEVSFINDAIRQPGEFVEISDEVMKPSRAGANLRLVGKPKKVSALKEAEEPTDEPAADLGDVV